MAIRLQPDLAATHDSLGNILKNQGKLEQAVAEYRTAIRLERQLPRGPQQPRQRLGGTGEVGGRHAEYRAAIQFKPRRRRRSTTTSPMP